MLSFDGFCAINFATSTAFSVNSFFGINNENEKSIPILTSRFFYQKPTEHYIVNTATALEYMPEK